MTLFISASRELHMINKRCQDEKDAFKSNNIDFEKYIIWIIRLEN